jgi:voltage-gated potassium channel
VTTRPNDSLWYRLRWLVALLAAALVYGTAGYMVVEGWGFIDSLYMTAITFSTVGFREVRPLDTSGKLFSITVIVVGVVILFITISLTARWIAEVQLGPRTRRKRMERRIEALHDHYIVCAYGRVGRAIAREFEAEGVPFVVLEPNEALSERMVDDGVLFMLEDPSEEGVLTRAGVQRARGLVCAVDSDATNVYITLTARSLNPSLFIVARASEPGSAQRLERAGADRIVSPFVSSGRHMVRMARDPAIVDLFDEGSGGEHSIDVEERLIEADSPLIGMRVAEVPGAVLAIRRVGGRVEPSPPGDLRLADGDVVLLLPEVPAPD